MEGYVCSRESGECSSKTNSLNQVKGDFNLTLNDGPIQFSIRDAPILQSERYSQQYDSFSVSSQKILLKNKINFSSEPSDPRIYIYEVVSPDYSKTWVHSSSRQYIEARPWLLSMLSVSILKPAYIRKTLVHIPGGACPSKTVNKVEQDSKVADMIKQESHFKSNHIITLKENGMYYEIIHNVDNEYKYKPIPFLNENRVIAVSLIVS